ncbi:MAG: trypsin-like peptidase domain-containing protein [Gloeomargaritaceae cyanobacterium C42_A2020_066]|nr:trypsin-like peptidase domain-containing protein [Gloeomargaritaceae cyanobacterium C42_A2020_066]
MEFFSKKVLVPAGLAGAVVLGGVGYALSQSQPQQTVLTPEPAIEAPVAPTSVDTGTSGVSAAQTLELALADAEGAMNLESTAQTPEDRALAGQKRQQAVAMLQSIPKAAPEYATAQRYLAAYQSQQTPATSGSTPTPGTSQPGTAPAREPDLTIGTRGLFTREITLKGVAAAAKPLTPAQIIQMNLPGSVALEGPGDSRGASCSGQIIGKGLGPGGEERAFVMTAFHCITEAKFTLKPEVRANPDIDIRLYDRSLRKGRLFRLPEGGLPAFDLGQTFNPFLVPVATSIDMALIEVLGDPSDLRMVPLCPRLDRVKVGEEVIAMGAPGRMYRTFEAGVVSAIRTFELGYLIQLDVPIYPGNSGGPLFNRFGAMIGMNNAGAFGPSAERINYNTPVGQSLDRLRVKITPDGCGPARPGSGNVASAPGTK